MPYKVELRNAIDPPSNLMPKLIWTDIPFNTNAIQNRGHFQYKDNTPEMTLNALTHWSQILADNGTMIICCDYRMAWKVCATLSNMVYQGEIIWEFGLGRPRTNWWPIRHNNLLTFTKHKDLPIFNTNAVPRTKRLAPKPGYTNDKIIGSVWDFTLSNLNKQRIGYPNQKPLEIIEPFVLAHTDIGDLIADPFCGSSSTGIAALKYNRNYYGCDINKDAIAISLERLECLIRSERPKVDTISSIKIQGRR